MFLSKFSQTKTNTGSFVLYPDLGKSSGSAFRNTAANQCGGSGSVGIISLDPDPGQCVEMVGRGGQCVEMGERGGGQYR